MKTIEQINDRIKKGEAVVLTAAEAKHVAEKESVRELARKVDVVTTATFSPMCSSGMFINVGHARPALKMERATFDGVPAYGGIATADLFLGATERHPDHPHFGGAHVIAKFVRGEAVEVEASGIPTDCYPGHTAHGRLTLEDVNQAYLFNPRNLYQNYNAAVNSSPETMRTYMGVLRPRLGSVNYSGSGEISPLLNDPFLRTIGVGTPLFCCGTVGYVAWEGTQSFPGRSRNKVNDVPIGPSVTLAIVADLRGMKPEFIRPVAIPGYGISLYVAIGVGIPILDEDMAFRVSVRNRDIKTNLVDYATGDIIGQVNYESLLSGGVAVDGKTIPSRTMSDNRGAKKVMEILKHWILTGNFPLREAVKPIPMNEKPLKPFGG